MPDAAEVGPIDYPRPQAIKDQGQVSVQLDRLQAAIDRIENATTELSVSLMPILRDDFPTEKAVAEDMPGLVPLADRLYRMCDHLESVLARVKKMDDRVSL